LHYCINTPSANSAIFAAPPSQRAFTPPCASSFSAAAAADFVARSCRAAGQIDCRIDIARPGFWLIPRFISSPPPSSPHAFTPPRKCRSHFAAAKMIRVAPFRRVAAAALPPASAFNNNNRRPQTS